MSAHSKGRRLKARSTGTNDELRRRLEEAEQTLAAIRQGDIDALVVDGPQGEQVYSLAGAEHVYRVIVETMNEAALTVDPAGTILFCNRRFCDLMKTPIQGVLGRRMTAFVAKPQQVPLQALLVGAQAGPVQRRLTLRAADGTAVPVQLAAGPLQSGASASICLVMSDLTELEASAMSIRVLREHQEALEESEHRYQELVRCAPAGIFEIDFRCRRFTSVNDAMCRISGYSRQELLALDPFDLLDEQSQIRCQARIGQWLRGQEPERNVEYRVKTKDGRTLEAFLNVMFTTDENGSPLGATVVAHDITERKGAERQREADLAALTRMHDLSTKLLEAEGLGPLLQEIRDAAVAIMGADRGTLQLLEGDALRIVAHCGHQRPFLDFFASNKGRASVCGEALKQGRRVVVEDVERSPLFAGTASLKVLREAGIRAVQSTPLPDRHGTLLGILTTQWSAPHVPDEHDLWRLDLLARQAADLIEHKRAQEALRSANEDLRAQAEQLQTVNDMLQTRQKELEEANECLRMQEQELVHHTEALRESEERYRTLLETAPDAVVVYRDGRFLYANSEALLLAGAESFDHLARHGVLDFFRAGDREQAVERTHTAMAGHRLPVREGTLLRLNGQEVQVEIHMAPVDFQGARAVLTIIRDITDRKRAEEVLKVKESAIASSLNPIALADLDGRLTYVNPAFLKLWGYNDEHEILGKPALDFWQEPQRALEVVQAIRHGGGWAGELVAAKKDGTPLNLHLSAGTVLSDAGTPLCMMASFLDITERRQAEGALARSEENARQRAEELAALMDVTPAAVWVSNDPRCAVITGNRAAQGFYEAAEGENLSAGAIGGAQDFARRFFQDGRELKPEELPMQVAAAQGIDVRDSEIDVLLPSGKTITILGNASPLFDAGGRVRGSIAAFVDITERKRAEETLRRLLLETQQRCAEISALMICTRTVLERPDLISAIRVIFDACRELLGAAAGYVAVLSPDGQNNEVLFLDSGGLSCTVDPSLPMPVRGFRAEVYHTGRVMYENDFAHSAWAQLLPSGHVPLANVLFAPLVLDGRTVGLLGLGNKAGGFTDQDATLAGTFGELVAIALRNSRVLDSLRQLNATLESKVAARTAELERERRRLYAVLEAMPAMVCLLTPDYHVAFANRSFREKFGEANGRHCYEFCYGRTEPCEFCETYEVLKTGRPHRWEVTGPDGRTIIEAHDFPFTDVDGSPLILEMDLDITERKCAEAALRKLNEALAQRTRQLQRLTLELSQAEERERRRVAEILHEDLQQQLAGAKFHLSLLRTRSRDDPVQEAIAGRVDEILKEAVEQSRSLSHELSPAVLHMNDLGEVLRWLANRVRTQHGLTVHLKAPGGMTLPSEALTMFLFRATQETLFNVIKHARVTEATVRVRRLGRYLGLSVSDRGQGFDPQQLQETAGFGLLGIRERVALLGGRMKIRSVKGRGSRFRIVVPCANGPEDVSPAARASCP